MSLEQNPPAPASQSHSPPATPATRADAPSAQTAARIDHQPAAEPTTTSTSLATAIRPSPLDNNAPAGTTAGQLAEAVPSAPQSHGETNCANCGALLTGRFCSNCGQRREHEIHSIWHFTQEAAEDLTHADSRLWSTLLALMFKPGLLTQEFLAGKRVKHLPPLRLYLVMSVLFFLVLGAIGGGEPRALFYTTQNGKTTIGMVNPDQAQELAPKPGETPQQRADRVCNVEYDGPGQQFVVPFIKKGCRQSLLDNGHTITEATLHNIPRAMFIFVPALAVVMKLMYWRPRRYYIEHLLFFVHNHAFIFALFGLDVLLLRIAPAVLHDWIQLVVWGYTAYYLFVSMRRVYGQGRFTTFLKYSALSFTYLFGAALTLALTVTYSVYAL